jgi:PrtD family type I secretion system ABC transporter
VSWLLSASLRPWVLLAAWASLVLNLALLVPSIYMLQVFDRVFASRSLETLVMLAALAGAALLLGWCMDRARTVLLLRAGLALDERLSLPALEAMLVDSAMAAGQVPRALLNDVARLRSFLASPAVQALFDAPWLPVYLLVITALNPLLGAAALASAVTLFALGFVSERLLRRDAAEAVQASQRAAHRVEALLRQAEVVLGLGMLGRALAWWGADHRAALAAQQRAGHAAAALAATGRALRQGVQVLMLTLGAWLVVAGHASPGVMVATTVLLGRALQPVEHLIAGWKALLDVRAAWQRLQVQRGADDEREAALRLPAPRGELCLERVSLLGSAGAAPLLKQASLALVPGECLGIVGPSGAGKTTLLRVMLGLRRPQAGTVRLDGVELHAWPREQLAEAFGYLPQDVQLFAGTVAQNIAQLGEVDAARVVEAARLAGVHEMIARLPQAYDSEIGEAGAVLSGGQRQRIGLARALYGAPRVLVLDEPDANLDAAGEQALRAAIDSLKQAGTAIVLVSHHPALMRHADRLAVLREGAIDCIGARDEVLARLSGRTVHTLRPTSNPSTNPTPSIDRQEALS